MVGTILRNALRANQKVVRDAAARFPYEVLPNGSCSMLKDRKCTVYDHRPDICNLSKMAALTSVPEPDYYRLNAMVCNLMIDLEGMGEEWKVKFE